MHLLPVYNMYPVHVCPMLHMYNVQCVCSRILLTVYHHNGIKISYFIFYQIESSRKIPTYRCDTVAVKVFCLFFFWW